VKGEYAFEVAKRQKREIVVMKREGAVQVNGERAALYIRKEVSLGPSEPSFRVEYELTNPSDRPLDIVFAVENIYCMLAAHAPDRFYYEETREQNLGELATRIDRPGVRKFGLVDGWQRLDVGLKFSTPANLWAFPLETVSQSEGGFESVYQGSVVVGRWNVRIEPGGSWKVWIESGFQTLETEEG
jgi:alpha-amylase